MNTILVKNVYKKFKNATILSNISFSVSKGEVLGIIGRNGAGKSTLLKIIIGMLKPDEGSVIIENNNEFMDSYTSIDKIGFFIEEPPLYPFLTGLAQLKQVAYLHNIKFKKQDVDSLVKIYDIGPFIEKKIGIYSLGMKQKLALTCCILHNPDIVILDEPTNHLDIESIKLVREVIRKFKREGKIVIISSHIFSEVEEVCDKIIILEDGKIIEEKSMGEVLKTNSLEKYYFEKVKNNEISD